MAGPLRTINGSSAQVSTDQALPRSRPLSRETALQEVEGRGRESVHVRDPIRAPGLQRKDVFHRTGYGETSVSGGVAIAIAGRAGRAGLGEAPIGTDALPHRAGQ
jgi:hypothetical protein